MIFYLLFLLYNFIWIFVLFYFFFYFLIKLNFRAFIERCGFYDLENFEYIWVHASSVGEVKIANKLIEEIRNITMEPIILTVTTETGYKLFREINKTSNVYLKYALFDFLPIIIFFLNKFRINKLILIETEIWPSYIMASNFLEVKTYIVNGRISDKSYPRYMKYKIFFNHLFSKIDFIFVQSKLDRNRFISIGALNSLVLENMKYDLLEIANDIDHSKPKNFKDKLIFVAGSIREGEEKIIIGVFNELKEIYSNLVLIIAPRHLKNVEYIKSLLNVEKYCLFSDYGEIDAIKNKDIIIVDVIGKLIDVYKIADVVFVGGSLVNKGGQNIIEPLSLGKFVLFGPYMQNFKDISEKILAVKGAVIVKNKKDLLVKLKFYLENKNERCQIVHRALKELKYLQGATLCTARHIFRKEVV